jgi:FkbM family methyltransferase
VDASARQAQQEAIGINAVLASALGGEGTYVDAGTNRGQVLRNAVRVAPGGMHVAFEPIPELAAALALEFPTVDCRSKALSSQPGTAEFCHFRQLDGWSGLRRRPEISDRRGEPEFITVGVSTLDIELAALEPAVVKIDVEGAEVAVLEGATGMLSRSRPLVIFEHVYEAAALYGAEPGAPWELLHGLDYEIFSITGDGPYTRSEFIASTATVNWLATPLRSPAGRPRS